MSNVAFVPLFERLIDEDLDEVFEATPKRFSTPEELRSSIQKDLENLLNTRSASLWKKFDSSALYSYGVNITAPASAPNVFEIQKLESEIDDAIKQFEPRLIDAKSRLVCIEDDPSKVRVSIDAMVMLENRKTPLSFPIVIDL